MSYGAGKWKAANSSAGSLRSAQALRFYALYKMLEAAELAARSVLRQKPSNVSGTAGPLRENGWHLGARREDPPETGGRMSSALNLEMREVEKAFRTADAAAMREEWTEAERALAEMQDRVGRLLREIALRQASSRLSNRPTRSRAAKT